MVNSPKPIFLTPPGGIPPQENKEWKFLKTCGLRRVTQGYTGLHSVQFGATDFFYFWRFFTIFAIWSQTVTSCDQLVTLFCSLNVQGWLYRVKMAFLWFTKLNSANQSSACYDLVTPCDHLVTPLFWSLRPKVSSYKVSSRSDNV